MTQSAAKGYVVYILECADGTYYTGITTDIVRRFLEHEKGIGGHYTRAHRPVRIAYTEPHPDRSSASKREAFIKHLGRAEKSELIRNARR